MPLDIRCVRYSIYLASRKVPCIELLSVWRQMDYNKLYEGMPESVPKTPKEAQPVNLPPLPESTDIRERAKAVEPDIFMTYYTMMMSDETPPAIRKSCADALADRARGKPAQSMEIQGKITHETLIINRSVPKPIGPVIDVITDGG